MTFRPGDEIADLIKRVEAATPAAADDFDAADKVHDDFRRIDAGIFKALGTINEHHCALWCGMDGRTDLTRNDYIAAWAPEYTASVDAVIGLIGEKMPGANWQLEFMSGRHLSVLYPDAASGSFSGDGAGTPALSLLLAFLRAWEQRGDG